MNIQQTVDGVKFQNLVVCQPQCVSVADPAGYTGTPLQMYESPDLYVQAGDEVRLFCEAFVGKY
jgi:hypothetical protein